MGPNDARAAAAADPGDKLRVEFRCTECGGSCEAGLYDYSAACAYCGSLLVIGSGREDDLFTVADADSDTDDLLDVLVTAESARHRSKLLAELPEIKREAASFDPPPEIQAEVARYARDLRGRVKLRRRVDFFAPYEVSERTVLQGILGRRGGGVKESFVQCFRTEEIERRYDQARFNLRDRGLKIRGLRLRRLDEKQLALVENRFLPVVRTPPLSSGTRFDRSRFRIDPGTQIIGKHAQNWRERTLNVYKHFTYAGFSHGRDRMHVLVDQQFGTVAARPSEEEAETYLALLGDDLSKPTSRPDVHAIASDCPDCGWELRFPECEQIVFCGSCRHAVRVDPKGLVLVPYLAGAWPETGTGAPVVYVPCWAFRFRVHAGGREFRRLWDWLAALSPDQSSAESFREEDPEESRYLIPARNLLGAKPLDEAFTRLTGVLNWRQTPLRVERPLPNDPASMLGVELTAKDAAALAHFALLALHDVLSTRRMNLRNFKEYVQDARLDLGEPELAALPLPIQEGAWRPAGARFAIPLPLLESRSPVRIQTKSFNLA